jgi:hypothetical protein
MLCYAVQVDMAIQYGEDADVKIQEEQEPDIDDNDMDADHGDD